MRIDLRPIVTSMFFLLRSGSACSCLRIAGLPQEGGPEHTLSAGIKRAFDRAGLCTYFLTMPIRHIQKEMAAGRIDGEYVRVKPYIHSMKQIVIPIKPAIVEKTGHIVTLASSNYRPKSIGDVKVQVIGVVQGVRWQSHASRKIGKIHRNSYYFNLARLLKIGRIEGFLSEPESVDAIVANGLLERKQIYISPSIADLSAFLLLHKKHKKYVKQLEKAVRDIRTSEGFERQ